MTQIAATGVLLLLHAAVPLLAVPARESAQGKLKVAVVKNDSEGPKAMAGGGLVPMLEKLGCEITAIDTVELTAEKAEYGAWNRDALESRRIGKEGIRRCIMSLSIKQSTITSPSGPCSGPSIWPVPSPPMTAASS